MGDCFQGTGEKFSSTKLKRATHGAVCASKIITWDQKTRARSTQRSFSEGPQNASDQSAMWKCDLLSRKRKENMWMWCMWETCVTAASLEGTTSYPIPKGPGEHKICESFNLRTGSTHVQPPTLRILGGRLWELWPYFWLGHYTNCYEQFNKIDKENS